MEATPESFTATCWYFTGLMRFMLQDTDALLRKSPEIQATREQVLAVRLAEYPLRSFLDFEWSSEEINTLARRNQSRLKVFDEGVEDGISQPTSFCPESLICRLLTWHERLDVDVPLSQRARRLDEALMKVRQLEVFWGNRTRILDLPTDDGNLSRLLSAWVRVIFESSRSEQVESFNIAPDRLKCLAR